MENVKNEQELSHEELQARKEEMKQFYTESIPYLEAQLKYESLLTSIEDARFKRATYQYQWAAMMQNSMPHEDEKETETETPKERKLKKS